MTRLIDSEEGFGDSGSQEIVLVQLGHHELDRHPGLGFDALRGQEIHVPDFMGVFAEVAELDQAFLQKTFDDVVDLAQADAGVFGDLALVGDFFPVEGVQYLECFFGEVHSVVPLWWHDVR